MAHSPNDLAGMICPICGNEMERGGILSANKISWYPEVEFEKKGFGKYFRKGERIFEHYDDVSFQTRIRDTFLCKNCNIVSGLWRVRNLPKKD